MHKRTGAEMARANSSGGTSTAPLPSGSSVSSSFADRKDALIHDTATVSGPRCAVRLGSGGGAAGLWWALHGHPVARGPGVVVRGGRAQQGCGLQGRLLGSWRRHTPVRAFIKHEDVSFRPVEGLRIRPKNLIAAAERAGLG